MSEVEPGKDRRITPNMTVLEVVDRYRETEAVFKKYDEQVGVCFCCQALFETLKDVSEKYGLNLEQILSDIESAISQ